MGKDQLYQRYQRRAAGRNIDLERNEGDLSSTASYQRPNQSHKEEFVTLTK
jgi:hypothetical protein